MTLFENWPHNWFGLWKTSEADSAQVPLFTDVVDPAWNPPDLADILAYLRSCPVALASSAGAGACPLCGEMLNDLGCQRSDGVWVWPASLEHYVSRHQVRLPDRMVEQIRGRQYRVPTFGPASGTVGG
jgi:hypothetical protein